MKALPFFLLVLILTCSPAFGCTSAVISGKATPDGRPLLWKHRDTSNPENALRSFDGKIYSFTGVVNVDSTSSSQIWAGANEAGFAIMNTASYNLLSQQKYDGDMDLEGIMMMEALGRCGSIDEFEKLLLDSNGSRGIEANFGTIDSTGAAAWFETGPLSFKKYDANDPETAPDGYIVRTNYSVSGDTTKGYGYIRHETASILFEEEYDKNRNISLDFIILEATRSLKHSLLDLDHSLSTLPDDENDTRLIPMNDYIPRSNSASTIVIQGVTTGEDPSLTVLWTILGFQLVTPVYPVIVGYEPPPALAYIDDDTPPYMNAASLELKARCFPIKRGSGDRYMDLAPLLNRNGNGILTRLIEIDRVTLEEGKMFVSFLRRKGVSAYSIDRFYKRQDPRIRAFFRSAGIEK